MNQTNCEKHKRLEWNTYEKLTCWRMLKSNFCTFFFILRVLCFVFLLFSLSNAPYFPCPVISSSLGAFCCSFGRRNERTKVYQSSKSIQVHQYHSTNNTRNTRTKQQQFYSTVPKASAWPWDPWDPWASHLSRPPAVRAFPLDASWWHDCCVDFCKFLIF